MNPGDLPLRDIHLPEPVGWWPPAPGWWLLAAILLAAAAVLWRYHQRREARLRRRIASELKTLSAQWHAGKDHHALLSNLSSLLRRSAIALDGRLESAGLSGSHWQRFLNRGLADEPFSKHPGDLLIDATYRPTPPQLTEEEVAELTALCRRWITEARHGDTGRQT